MVAAAVLFYGKQIEPYSLLKNPHSLAYPFRLLLTLPFFVCFVYVCVTIKMARPTTDKN